MGSVSVRNRRGRCPQSLKEFVGTQVPAEGSSIREQTD